MIAMTLGEVAAATGGTLRDADPRTRVSGTVEYDSRRVGPGGLFVAFVGERVDGHDFAGDALAAGAVAVLATRQVAGVPTVLVDDPYPALAALARSVVDRLPELTVVALTGSSGKTTTKDMIADLAGRIGPTVAPAGSFNNELGHPYTVLQSGPDTRFLVLENGARGPGHIAHLCAVAPPQIGVVLNVGVAHIGEFGSVAEIAAAKGELVEALPAGGVAVLNLDDPQVAAMAGRTAATVAGYALDGAGTPEATVRATEVRLDARGRARYTLVTPDGTVPVRLAVAGEHQVSNTLAAAAVALELGMTLPDVARSLGELQPRAPRRMEVVERPDGVTLIDDSYNANPGSVAVALRALAAMGAPPGERPRRTVAVLGYLAELGPHERAGHEEVGRLAAGAGVDLLVVVGEAAAAIRHGAVGQQQWGGEAVLVTGQDEASEALAQRLCAGDVVLVKGSRYQTWDVADRLREPPPPEAASVEVGR